jgi:hypothetical protein
MRYETIRESRRVLTSFSLDVLGQRDQGTAR